MRIIDSTPSHISLVVDEARKLIGTLTDGDIRRALLHGESLTSPVRNIINRSFHSLDQNQDKTYALDLMKKNQIKQMPIIDSSGKIIDLLFFGQNNTSNIVRNPVVIMAGGKGTRLRPFTENCPKPMLPIDGKPMLEILLENCISSGFRDFYFSVNYLKEQIIDYFGDGKHWDVSINYLVESEPLGTAGSLKLLPEHIDEPVLVLNGDVLTSLNLSHLLDFHNYHNAKATLCVRKNETTIPFGVVQVDGLDLIDFEEKPMYTHLVNAGVYIIDPKLLSYIQSNCFTDMPTLLQASRDNDERVIVYPIHEYWIDVGRPETLEEAHKTWKNLN